MQVDLAPWIFLKHDDLLEDRLQYSAELLHLHILLDVSFVLHRTEVCLEESHVQDAFL